MSSLPNEIFADITNFLPNDDITDQMLTSRNFNALVTPRLRNINQEMSTMNQSIKSFKPWPWPETTDWITQLNLKRFEPVGSKAKERMRQMFSPDLGEFMEYIHNMRIDRYRRYGTLDGLKERMSLGRFDDTTFLRILFILMATPKFRQEINISRMEARMFFHIALGVFYLCLNYHGVLDVIEISTFYNPDWTLQKDIDRCWNRE